MRLTFENKLYAIQEPIFGFPVLLPDGRYIKILDIHQNYLQPNPTITKHLIFYKPVGNILSTVEIAHKGNNK